MWGELFASDSENRVLQLVLQTEMAMEMLNQRKLMYLLEPLEVQLHAFFLSNTLCSSGLQSFLLMKNTQSELADNCKHKGHALKDIILKFVFLFVFFNSLGDYNSKKCEELNCIWNLIVQPIKSIHMVEAS